MYGGSNMNCKTLELKHHVLITSGVLLLISATCLGGFTGFSVALGGIAFLVFIAAGVNVIMS